eukprot:5055974-Pleurochrysis_carterae.AAC.1
MRALSVRSRILKANEGKERSLTARSAQKHMKHAGRTANVERGQETRLGGCGAQGHHDEWELSAGAVKSGAMSTFGKRQKLPSQKDVSTF